MMRLTVLGVLLVVALSSGCPDTSGLDIMPLDDQRVRVNDTLVLDLRVRSATGGETWSFSAPSLPDIDRHAALYPSGASATFRWPPLASHVGRHQFTFTVAAGGASDSETVDIEVIQGGGAPRFIRPHTGGTYDLTRNPTIEVSIEVIDEDSLQVDIRERQPTIEGGQLTQVDGTAAVWRWTPTPQQVDATLRYTLRLEADDRQHSPVRFDHEIILLTEGRDDCPGAPPVIVETAPQSSDRLSTVRDYEVTATITDDQGFKDMPVLYYSTEPPADTSRPDLTSMRNVTFEADGRDRFRAYIPNLRLSVGEERTIHYVVVATDNDDPNGTACDHTTRSSLRSFVVTEPEIPDRASYCDRCSHDAQCADGLCVIGDPHSFCGTDCSLGCGDATCQEVTSRDGVVDRQCVPNPGQDCRGGGGDCEPDAYEPQNDSEATAPRIELGSVIEGRICPGDEDFYAVSLTVDTRYRVTATGWDASTTDIDVDLLDPSGVSIGYGWGTTDIEEFEVCPVQSGLHHVWLMAYDPRQQGPYLLEVVETTGSCCEDDRHEPNDSRASAVRMVCGTGVEARICEGNEDWWSISVTTPSTIGLDMVCDSGSGDLDLELYDSAGVRLARSVSASCDESLTASLSAAGTYYARVYGYGSAQGRYLIDCSLTAGASCTSTRSCPAGTVCGASGCIDDFCDDPGAAGECPSGHFCPEPGGNAADSDCMDPCVGHADCRAGYACKRFDEGRGCGREGTGQTGQPCGSFGDCAGERTCLTAGATGYCAEINCTTTADCPTDTHTGYDRAARCVDTGGGRRICLMDCLMGDSFCDINPGTCQSTRDVGGSLVWVCALPGHTVP